MICRHCKSKLTHKLVDLGKQPPSNAYLTRDKLNCIENDKCVEKQYPLKVLVCDNCFLVQTEDFVGANEMFSKDYAYFSSYSSTWVNHTRSYIDLVVNRFSLNSSSCIVEIAANDGHLLQHVQNKKIPCYGVEPTESTALVARSKGIEIVGEFFGIDNANFIANKHGKADLMVANNVLAHVPRINDFVSGFSVVLKRDGVATFEFPYLLNLIKGRQFDTIYHEHYSYLSFTSVVNILSMNGLMIFDIDELSTHGGSLRIYAQRTDTGIRSVSKAVQSMLIKERLAGMNSILFYSKFQKVVDKIKLEFLEFLINAKRNKLRVAAYSAAAKGNTLINFLGIKSDLIHCIADKNIDKQGKFLPGSHIPIVSEKELEKYNPHYVIIMAWNIKDEIIKKLKLNQNLHSKFVTVIPEIIVQ